MINRWHRAPWWVVAIVAGILYGAVGAVVRVLMGGVTWSSALVSSAVGAVPFGVLMGWTVTRQRDRARAVLGGLDDDGERRAVRAASRGPVPSDPDVRAAATRLVEHRLLVVRGQRASSTAVFALGAAACSVAALAWSPWWWLLAGFSAVVLASSLWQVRRLQRRLAVLGGAAPVPGAPAAARRPGRLW